MGSAVRERENAEPAGETTETPLGKGTGKHSQMYCSNSPFIDLNTTRMNTPHYLGVFSAPRHHLDTHQVTQSPHNLFSPNIYSNLRFHF